MALAGNDLISITFRLYQGYFDKKCPSTSNYAVLGLYLQAVFEKMAGGIVLGSVVISTISTDVSFLKKQICKYMHKS